MATTQTFEEILFPHAGYHKAGGAWRCACLHTYEPANDDPGQPEIIAARHAQHMSDILIKAGAKLINPDPRQAFRERIANRGK